MTALRAMLAVCALALLASACGDTGTGSIPTPPNMSALIEAYRAPSLPLDDESLPAVLAALDERFDMLAGFCGADDASCTGSDVLFGALGAVSGTSQSQGALGTTQAALTVGGRTINARAGIRVRRICPGWGEVAVPDDAHGLIDLFVTADDGGFDPIVWGEMTRCLVRAGDRRFDFRSRIELVLGDGTLASLTQPTFTLFRAVGEVLIDDRKIALDVDAFLSAAGELRLRLPVGDAHLLFFQGDEGVGLDAANGRFSCDFEARTCQGDAGTFSF